MSEYQQREKEIFECLKENVKIGLKFGRKIVRVEFIYHEGFVTGGTILDIEKTEVTLR